MDRLGRFILASLLLHAASAQAWQVISSTHYCGHANGGYPARCYTPNWLDNVVQGAYEDKCQALCAQNAWCMAYSFMKPSHCALMTSTGSCSGSSGSLINANIATSISQLTVSGASGYSCIAKSENFNAGNDCVLGAGLDPAAQCTTACESLTQSIETAATGSGTCNPATHQCVSGEGSCGAMVAGCTNQDSSTSFVDRLGELACICNDFRNTGQIAGGHPAATALMDGKVKALQQMNGGAAIGTKFHTSFSNMVSRWNYLDGFGASRVDQWAKKWKKLCRKVTRGKPRKHALKIDNANQQAKDGCPPGQTPC